VPDSRDGHQTNRCPSACSRIQRELEAELAACDESVLRHHCLSHDFSRWVADVFRDGPLAADLAAAEASLTRYGPAAVVEQVRLALIAALQARRPR